MIKANIDRLLAAFSTTTMSDDDDVDGRAPTGPARTKAKARLVEGYNGVQFMMDTSYAARPYQV